MTEVSPQVSPPVAHGAPPSLRPLGVVRLDGATVFPVHPSPDPHRMHYGVLRADGTLLQSTVEDRRHGQHTFIPPDPGRFDTVESLPREAIYAGPLYHVYGHFLLESCARLWWAVDHPELPIVWTADDATAPELTRWESDILDILGVHNEVAVVTRPTRVDGLHVPDAGYRYADYSHPQQIAFLAAYDGPAQVPGSKLWLSRDPAHGRGLTNRHIVERRLRDLGWTVVTFELMPVRAQLDALAAAELVAGEEASTFHNLLLLRDIRGKRFQIFRRHGPEHLSFTTIGAARDVAQQFHSCSRDAVVSVAGRAVVRLAPNPAQYLSHLGVPIPPRPVVPDADPGPRIRRLNRLVDLTGAQTCLQLGWPGAAAFARTEVTRRDIVDPDFGFDVRSYRDQGAELYEVSVNEFLTRFAGGRRYDLVVIGHHDDQQQTVDTVVDALARAGHDRTVVVVDGVLRRTALRDRQPELTCRTMGRAGDRQTVVWRRGAGRGWRFPATVAVAAVRTLRMLRRRVGLATATR